jgi:putative flippase GtrA
MMNQFFKFAAVGAASTLSTYTVLITLVEVFSVSAVTGSLVGYIAGAAVNYVLNRRYTFSSNMQHRLAVPRFALIIVVGFVLNTAIMYYTVSSTSIHYILAQLAAVAVVLVWSYSANRLWTFKQSY